MKDISSTLTFEYTTKKPVYKIENQVKQEQQQNEDIVLTYGLKKKEEILKLELENYANKLLL